MNAIILSTGDELVLGQTVDTNSAWLSQQLAGIGIPVVAHISVGDDQKSIQDVIERSVRECNLLIISGGIGPTEDDRTRHALADALSVELIQNQPWLQHLESYFQKLGRQMPEKNKVQALIPNDAELIWNHYGTAAGIRARYETYTVFKDKALVSLIDPHVCAIFVLPGVPKEMKAMFTNDVLPRVKLHSGHGVILSKTVHTFGLGESSVAEKLGELMARTRNPSVGTTVANGIVSLRINARFGNREQAEKELAATERECREALGDIIFGSDEETLPLIVSRLLTGNSQLATGNYSVTAAESCTGGLLAKMLTDIPGSSSYFTQGWVVYSNLAKHDRLGVPTEILNIYGAVSEPVVEHLARNARRLAKADFALSISGIAGPDGGTATKPVGTVCICLAYGKPNVLTAERVSESLFITRTFVFTGDREMIRDRSAKMALSMLRFQLLGKEMPF